MTREQLEHAIRSACDVADDVAVYVFGSQAILGQFPDASDTLRRSIEVDLCPVNRVDRSDAIEGAMGELSQFHETYGFYVQGVSMDTAVLPDGWKSRVLRVENDVTTRGKTGLCLEVHDLAASKLVAFRDKDRDFVRELILERMLKPRTLITRIGRLPIAPEFRERLMKWVHLTVQES